MGWLVARRRSPPGGGLRRANSGGPGTTGGACVPVLDYDIDRLQSEVSYRDNGTNLDSAPLPVPEPLTPGDAASTD